MPASGDPTTIQPPTRPPPQVCSEETPDDGWIIFSKDQGGTDEFCYLFFDNGNAYDWIEAYDGCVQKGGRLASISSEQENNFVMNNLKDDWEEMSPNPAGWIGYQRDSKTGQFRWVDGSQNLEYESWGPNG